VERGGRREKPRLPGCAGPDRPFARSLPLLRRPSLARFRFAGVVGWSVTLRPFAFCCRWLGAKGEGEKREAQRDG
jgi:hypothetical protein